jgi:hypothetical protein
MKTCLAMSNRQHQYAVFLGTTMKNIREKEIIFKGTSRRTWRIFPTFAFNTWNISFTSRDTVVADSTSTFAYSIQKIQRSGTSSMMAKGQWHCITQRLIKYQNSALLYVEPWAKSVIVCSGGVAFLSQLLTCQLRLLVDSSVRKWVTSCMILQLQYTRLVSNGGREKRIIYLGFLHENLYLITLCSTMIVGGLLKWE